MGRWSISLPKSKSRGQELAARLLSVFLTALLLLFFSLLAYEHEFNSHQTHNFPRSWWLTIMCQGPFVGAFLGSLPLTLSACLSIIYKNDKIDYLFWIGCIIIFFTLLVLFVLFMQIGSFDRKVARIYLESLPDGQIIFPTAGDIQSRGSNILKILFGYYVFLLCGFLGMKGALRKVPDYLRSFRPPNSGGTPPI